MKSKVHLIAMATLLAGSVLGSFAHADDSTQMQLPRVEHGQLISPVPPPPPPSYPRVEEGRLYLNKDVSVSGQLSPVPQGNVRVPLPGGK